MTRRGPWISFEGIEGCGKSTQLARLAARLERAGIAVLATREPGGTALGRRLRAVLLRPSRRPVEPKAEVLLYSADRAQHLAEVVLPALSEGRAVLSDRHLDATLAYQGYGRGIDRAWIRAIHAVAPLHERPVRTLLLDLEPETALRRARRRESRAHGAREDRFEREEIEFHRRVRAGYLALAKADRRRIRVIDARGTRAEIERRVLDAVADLFRGLRAAR